MVAPHRISVVLPVYNEAGNVQACLRGLWGALEGESHEILVVYDFDEDTTLPAIEAMTDRPPSVRLVKNEIGRGAANALRAGFAAADGDVVVTTMADLSDPPELIPEMAREIRAGADVVSGSRYMAGGSQTGGPLLKRCMSQTASLLLNGVAGLTTLDATSNFRGYSKRYLAEVDIESDAGFEIALELTVKAHLGGRAVSEVPSSWTDRTDGESQFKLWKWLPNYLRWFARATREPFAAWGLFAVLALVAAAVARPPFEAAAGPGGRPAAWFVAALFAAGGACALALARRARGRTTWADLAHPVAWTLPVLAGVSGSGIPLGLGAAALASAVALALSLGRERFAAAARAGLARATDQRAIGVVLLGLLLWVTRFSWPKPTAGPALDASWEQAIGYALLNGVHWGDDIAFTFGPLGYFSFGRFDPELFWTKVLWWEVAFKGCLTVFLVLAVLRIRGPLLRTLAVLVLVLPMQGHDAYHFLAIVAIGAWLLEQRERPLPFLALGLVPLSAIALIKFTPLVLSFFCVGLVAVARARRRSLASGVGVLALFGASFCAVWLLAGQSLLALPAYLASSATIAGAYNEAMAVFGPEFEVRLAVGLALLAGLVALLAVLERPRTLERLALAALVAAGLFLAGKAGFVRHGDNAITFFSFAGAVTFLFPWRADATSPSLVRLRSLGSVACAALAVFGYHTALEHGEHSPNRLFGDWIARVSNNVQSLADVEGGYAELAEEREEMRRVHALTRFAETVGDATVDLLNSKQGVVFLSDMRWHPRPAFQSYYSYAPSLLRANRDFLESADAPRYVILRAEAIDGRVPTMDDSLAMVVLMRDYRPLMTEKDYLLLERREGAPLPSPETTIEERTLRFGETFDLPALAEGGVHLLRIDVRPTLLGKLGTTLAKAPQVSVHVTRRGVEERFKLVPGMAREGFLVDPFAVGQSDWLRWLSGRGLLSVEAVRVEISDAARGWFRPEVGVALVRVEGVEPVAGDLQQQLDFSSFVRVPDVVRTNGPVRRRTIRGQEYVIVGVPSELRFDLSEGAYAVRGGYGFDPRSYRKDPPTKGAAFAAVLVDAAGDERELWSRTLDPAGNVDDCQLQELELTFELDAPAQLCLRTTPVAGDGDPKLDLAFWYQLRVGPAE